MTVMTTSTLYIIFWFFACNWVFFLLPKHTADLARTGAWLLTLSLVLLAGFFLDRHYLGPPHQAWQESTVYVVFFFMSLLFSTVGYLFMKSPP